jgi:hypothetical protein
MTTQRLLQLLPLVLLCGCENKLTIELTDGPTDGAQEVVLDLASVKLLTEDDEVVELSLEDGDPVDLLAFQDGETFTLVGDRNVDPDNYVGIALEFDADGSFVTEADGDEITIDTPSTLTFTDIDFTIDDHGEVRIVLDLSLRFSLIDDGSGSFDLDPVMRAVRPGDTGTASGTVATAFVESDECRQGRAVGTGVAVYAFKGSSVTPADYDGQTNLIASANVVLDGGEYRYALHFLPAGAYTLALTCEADAEDPTTDDDLVFEATRNVSITAGSTATLDFL